MKLNTLERLMLLNVLPKEGSFANIKLLRIAREELSFDERENKSLNFRQEDNKTMWNQTVIVNKGTGEPLKGDPELINKMVMANPDRFEMKPTVEDKEISFGEVVTNLIIKALKDLDAQEKLTEQHFSVYEKFITEEVKT